MTRATGRWRAFRAAQAWSFGEPRISKENPAKGRERLQPSFRVCVVSCQQAGVRRLQHSVQPLTQRRQLWLWDGLDQTGQDAHGSGQLRLDDDKPKANEADLARRNLASMPGSADDFRAQLVDSMRVMARISLDSAIKPATYHGYTLEEDAIGEIHASFDAVVEAVVGARVKFDSARHAEIAQKYRAQIAAADHAFQAQFETLVRPNPRILEGGAQ